jgi:hypothetical protein
MANPILILHGWSDSYESFKPLKDWLAGQGYQAEQVFFGDYESMQDDVTFDDLADGLQSRFEDMMKKPRLDPFSLDVIVHSTGGLVVRHWLHHYIQDICNGDIELCPIRHLIMLAPANFGSRLAQEGQSALAKLFKGGVQHKFQTGRAVLQGLELGSPVTWRIANRDLFGGKKIYRSITDQGPFLFVFSGTATYGELKGFVAPGANEDGSDGTVRAAAASLNSIKIAVDCSNPNQPKAVVERGNYDPVAFALVPGKNHSEIVPSGTDRAHPTFEKIKCCLGVNKDQEYEQLRLQYETDNKAFYAGEKDKEDDKRVHRHQQFLIHVSDDMKNDVDDYRIEFHVVDKNVVGSSWNAKDLRTFDALKKYQRQTQFLQEEVIVDVEKHSVNPSYRIFFVNLDRLDRLQSDLKTNFPEAYIGMNIDAVGPTQDLSYETDKLRYLPVDGELSDSKGRKFTFFKENTSTLVEIMVQRVPGPGVMKLVW